MVKTFVVALDFPVKSEQRQQANELLIYLLFYAK